MGNIVKIILLTSIISSTVGCTISQSKIVQWEYKRVVLDPLDNKNIFRIANEGLTVDDLLSKYHKRINELGKQGWELVSTSPDTKTLFFKRRL